ncbi:PREDICTED: uncharacterized protein LOC106809640 [Priapulus caudatus]|uniref:Uncharacterized protein LOC106809640 n=1 Tax=Priapulus caudatus TaxID=37621 RepID=A0ABM1E7W8_PRICU|nr:PREDICTED: uncharacterized protein LOC106809640 [Priapulus caudatus]
MDDVLSTDIGDIGAATTANDATTTTTSIKCVPLPCEDQLMDSVYYFKQGYSFGEHGELPITEDNFYDNYDPVIGLNIAATLGTCIFLFVIFLIYKHHMKMKRIQRERERRRAARARAKSRTRSMDVSSDCRSEALRVVGGSRSRSSLSMRGSVVQYQTLVQDPTNAQCYTADTSSSSRRSSADDSDDTPTQRRSGDVARVDVERTPTHQTQIYGNKHNDDDNDDNDAEAGPSTDRNVVGEWLRTSDVGKPVLTTSRAFSMPGPLLTDETRRRFDDDDNDDDSCVGKPRTRALNLWPNTGGGSSRTQGALSSPSIMLDIEMCADGTADGFHERTMLRSASSSGARVGRGGGDSGGARRSSGVGSSGGAPCVGRRQLTTAQYFNELCKEIPDFQIHETKL